MTFAYLVAWLVPFVAGCFVYAAFDLRRNPGSAATIAGYGFVFGLLLASALTALAARADTAHAWIRGAPWLALVAVVAAGIAWRRRNSPRSFAGAADSSAGRAEGPESAGTPPRWQRIVLLALLASLVFRAAVAAREIWLRPTYPWDAWSAWMVKAKTWFLLGRHVPFGTMHDWLLQPAGADLHTGVAQHYPNALAWFEVWFASAAGGWIEPLINLPWLGVWVALLVAHCGQWRALGLDRMRALFFVYVLGSLPLLTVHAALAGYADIFVAALFGLAVLAWMRSLQQRDRSQRVLALVCAAALPAIKLEGWVWAASIVGAIAFGLLPVRWRWGCAAAAVLAFVALIVLGGAKALAAWTGNAEIPGQIALVLAPSWHADAMAGIGSALFAQPNWHLLWWLVLPIVVWRRRELLAHEWLWLPGLLIAFAAGLLLYLFLFTDASRWAQSYTAVNRLVLQITPAVVTFLALLLRDARLPTSANDTIPASGRRSGRA